MSAARILGVVLLSFGLVAAAGSGSEAKANPRPTRTAHPASQRTKPSSGAERRRTWKKSRADVKARFRALGHSFKKKK